MSLFYRVCVFAEPKGPWRSNRRKVRQDAIELGLGEYDADGRFWLNVPGRIEAARGDELKKRA